MPRKQTKSNNRHSKRNKKGQFAPTPDSPLIRWNKKGAAGFAYWIKDIQPQILTSANRYEPFKPTRRQVEIIKKILSSDSDGSLLHSLSLLIWPRRHGKSTIFALICLWLITSKQNLTVQLLGNSEQHVRRVQFNTLIKIIRNTPKLKQLIPDRNILSFEIKNPSRSNVIQMSAVNTSASFGDKINVLWVSDFHACPDMGPFNALQAALLDSEDSICLIDSNVDCNDGPVYSLQKESESDKSIFADHVFYNDFKEYFEKAPSWINRQKAKRLEKTTLPTDFARDILGKRSDAQNALFPSDVIELCKSNYKFPVSSLQALANGRAYKVGGGLDRSKSLFGGDNTVWTCILKVSSPKHGEPEIFVLNQEIITPNTSRRIKKVILKDHERYNLDNVVLENYEVSDIKPWLDDQKISNELVSAHDTNQNASFPEFYRIAREGRFHFPQSLTNLESEMKTFTYTQKTGGKYSFGHASSKFHDDAVYSVNWSIFALRSAVLNLYTIGNIQCVNKSPKKHICFLMGGELELFCKEQCHAYKEVQGMFRQFKQYQLDSELMLPEFFNLKVKLNGARISQAA